MAEKKAAKGAGGGGKSARKRAPKAPKAPKATETPKKPGTTPSYSKRARKSGSSRSQGRGARRPLQGATLLTRKNGFFALAGMGVSLWLVYFYPFSTDFTRRAALGLSVASLALLLGLFWRVRAVRWGILALVVGCGVFVAFPGRTNYDRLALRAEFATALRRYEGARYCKGGEGVYGIDGPGLVRRASIEAPFFYGIRTVNPWLIRHAFKAWWTRDLQLGRWPLSRRISKIKAVHGFNDLILYAGDYALLERGGGEPPAAMIYLGHHEWIVADENRATVLIVDGRKANASPCLQQSGALYRWRLLEARR